MTASAHSDKVRPGWDPGLTVIEMFRARDKHGRLVPIVGSLYESRRVSKAWSLEQMFNEKVLWSLCKQHVPRRRAPKCQQSHPGVAFHISDPYGDSPDACEPIQRRVRSRPIRSCFESCMLSLTARMIAKTAPTNCSAPVVAKPFLHDQRATSDDNVTWR